MRDGPYSVDCSAPERRGCAVTLSACGNDLIIAVQAVTFDLTVVSDNEREFARVAGLRVENWLKD